jgi:SAM-dependent methyltransferase
MVDGVEVVEGQSPELWRRRSSSFGGSAAAYADNRPDYAPAAIAWALAGADGPVREVVDLGAGTGILTAGLLASGLRVTAVEPDLRMLAELRRRLPDVATVAATAEAIPLPDGSRDAVVAGTAFHWFDRDRALTEIARVLRPGGVVAMFWHSDDDSVPWMNELGRLTRTSASSTPTEDEDVTRMRPHPAFFPFETERFQQGQRRTAESLTATIGTHSHTLVVSPEERAELLTRVRAFLDANPETASGAFTVPLVTRAYRARRL